MSIPFLNNIIIDDAGHIQFKTSAGTDAGKIDQDGDNLVLSNAIGDIIIGNGSDDVYIGDGTNAVDIRFEQNMVIYADSSSTRTLTLGGANTNLILESPTINGSLTLGATTINNKLTFTGTSGYILFDREPTGDTGAYDGTTSVPMIKVDRDGSELVVLERVSDNGALLLGNDDSVIIAAGDTRGQIRDNINESSETVIFSAESGFHAYGFPGNDTTWSNRNEFRFRSESTTASDNGLYIGDGGNTQFIDLSRNLKNIGNITLTGTVDGVDIAARDAVLTTTTNTANAAAPKASPTFTGDITIPNKIIHSGDTDTYMQFEAADVWRVVTGGTERLDINTNRILVGDGMMMQYDGISTSNSGTVVKGGFLNPASEANMVHIPHIVNDLAGFNKWSNATITTSGFYASRSGSSGSYTYSNEVTNTNSGWANAFDAHSSTAGSWYSDNGSDGIYQHGTDTPGVVELEWTNEAQYSLWAGIVFGSGSFTPTYVKIEAYRASAWQTLCEITDNTDQVILRQVNSNSGTNAATRRLKYTLGGSVNNSYFRIHSLYMANYAAGNNNLNNTGTDTTRGVNFLERYKDGYLHGHLRPGKDDTYDLGSSSYEWKDGYFDGTVYSDALNISGNITVSGTVDGVNISALPTSFAPTNADATPSWVPSSDPGYLTSSIASNTYLPLTGGTMTGDLTITHASTPRLVITDTTNDVDFKIRAANSYVYIEADTDNDAASTRFNFKVDGNLVHEILPTSQISHGNFTIRKDDATAKAVLDLSTIKDHTGSGNFAAGDDVGVINFKAKDSVVTSDLTVGTIITEADNTFAANDKKTRMKMQVYTGSALENVLFLDSDKSATFYGNIITSGTVDGVDVATLKSDFDGLGTAANFASSAFATSAQGTKADNALPKAGGTMTGDLTLDDGSGESPHIVFQDDDDVKFRVYNADNNDFIITRENNSGADFIIRANSTAYTSSYLMIGGATVSPTAIGNWNTAYSHSQAAHAPSNAEQNVQSDWNATSGDALILNKPNIPAAITDYVSKANGGTFSGAVTIDDNLTVTGNLIITGDINSYNVTDLDVADKTITIGKGQTESNSGGSGIIVDGSGANLLWSETNSAWEFNKKLEVKSKLTVDTIDNATSDVDKFLVSDTGEIKYRTGAQVLSDIGAQAAGSYQASGNYITGTGSLSAQDLTDIGNLSGTNTGDQVLPTASSLGAVTKTGTQTISGAKTFTSNSHKHSGHYYMTAYDAAGSHYPHFLDGSNNGGTTVNWRQYYGSTYKTHTWSSDSSGNMAFTFQGQIKANGELEGTSLDINGNADVSGTLNIHDEILTTAAGSLLEMYKSSWNNATNHDVLYSSWNTYVGDYLYLKAPGNSVNDHGTALIGDDVIAFGRSDVETGSPELTSATAPLSENWFVLNSSSATFSGGVTVEGGTLDLGKANTASGHINAKELMTFNIDTDNDDTNRYFAWYTNSSSGSGTELLKILETGAATFSGNIVMASGKTVDGVDISALPTTFAPTNADATPSWVPSSDPSYTPNALPLAGGTMTGNTLHGDDVRSHYGGSSNLSLYHKSGESFVGGGGPDDLFLSQSKGYIYIGTADKTTSTLYIDSQNKKVGFRTQTPGAAFDVNGSMRVRNQLNVGHTSEQNLYVHGDGTAGGRYVKMGDYGKGSYFAMSSTENQPKYCTAFGSGGKIVEDMRIVTIKLSGDAFKLLSTTGTTLIPAPGANSFIIPYECIIHNSGGTSGNWTSTAQTTAAIGFCDTTNCTYPGQFNRLFVINNTLLNTNAAWYYAAGIGTTGKVMALNKPLLLKASQNLTTVPTGNWYIQIRYQVMNKDSGLIQNVDITKTTN
jgi:hypothetical protein